ncbi:peptidoglycan binding domain containing protein [Pyrenophora tritici-repentis]|uniref:DUF2235 multi-domain protein n=1 Tax=Pyrenophora tritici-repentis TaxID=45151 RepID=A0A316ZYH7_9PLEO|nr:DUF2235 multi-domain protein [Pyrenophora tritici-repentis]KAI1537026.1 peptidoglycan binding domain containing protein [Pyrenophora tritici-repentis]KAI1542070.1 peptidoglycan binding domain containing protein [Pyrenophora tritici-repentis]KAI1554809.1 peptidoglycan binding domain containing protein [Pyrenophora tritici-repentis]KAI1578087.1 peptidoglycan binding domain containing protein [Pyrenophora tritici-repentis]
MADDKPWCRRLVVCCDGTWQSSVTSKANVPSNVTKLCRLIARTGSDRYDPTKKFHQIVYYDSGIGTGDLSHSEASRQGGTGAGLAENVIEAYNFIVQNYLPGDEIFCFGFSRGAYTARAVAGLVSDIGVISPVNMQLFPELYSLYMKTEVGVDFRDSDGWKCFTEGKLSEHGEELLRQGKTLEELKELSEKSVDKKQGAEVWTIRPHGDLAVSQESRKVTVVGVWDTVGALGIPDVVGLNFSRERAQYAFHNVKLTENIEHAFQALAMDERREAFRPTLWYIPCDVINDKTKKTPDLKQVWFPGVHTNCGGGSQDALEDMKEDAESKHHSTNSIINADIVTQTSLQQRSAGCSKSSLPTFPSTERPSTTTWSNISAGSTASVTPAPTTTPGRLRNTPAISLHCLRSLLAATSVLHPSHPAPNRHHTRTI